MFFKRRIFSLSLACTAAVVWSVSFGVTRANAGTLFSDNFESGSLSSSNWSIPGRGTIVVDPLNSSNHVLAFNQLATGGDIFTVPLNLGVPQITLSFDYLGLDGTSGVGDNTGGFAIIDLPNS